MNDEKRKRVDAQGLPSAVSPGEALTTTEHALLTQFAVERMADGVYWMNREGRILYVNEATCETMGYTRDELLQMHIYDLNPDISAQIWTVMWEGLRRDGKRTAEVRHRTRSGAFVPLEVVANFFVFNGREYSCAFTRDITERKQMEHRLRQSEKMRAVGLLAGGVAHDFNNQLAGISGCADLLDAALEGNEDARELVADIHLAVKRSADLTSQLLAFSRQGKYVSEPIDLHQIASEVLNVIEHSTSKRIRVTRRFDARWPAVEGDGSQLQNAVLNLAVNACDAMPNGGVLALSTDDRNLDENDCRTLDDQVSPGRYVVLRVTDSGIGMTPETMERMFEPFFTTKEKTGGTGLGLAAVYGTVKNHKGTIAVKSTFGRGTTFEVYLPVSSRLPAETVAARAEAPLPAHKLRVMVVEDEPFVREMAKRMLESLACEVVVFEDGDRALEFFRGAAHEIDLVLLDLCFPGLSGPETLARLKAISPQVKVLLASGYSLAGEAQEMLNNGAGAFLQKPYRRAALAQALHQLFGATPPSPR